MFKTLMLMTLAALGGCTRAIPAAQTTHCSLDNGVITNCDERR